KGHFGIASLESRRVQVPGPKPQVPGPKLKAALPFFDFWGGKFRWLDRRKFLRRKRFDRFPTHFPSGNWGSAGRGWGMQTLAPTNGRAGDWPEQFARG